MRPWAANQLLRQSKFRTALFLETILDQPCSTGLTVKLHNLESDALRPAYHELYGQLSSQPVLNIDDWRPLWRSGKKGYCGSSCVCPHCGGDAAFKGYASKTVMSLLGSIKYPRAYYYCDHCPHGWFPTDEELGLTERSTPGRGR